jgi:hypothetical protein
VGDLGEVGLVEQRQPDVTLTGQLLDRGSAQRGDPVEAVALAEGVDAGGGDHAAVADQHDAVQAEALGHGRHGGREV